MIGIWINVIAIRCSARGLLCTAGPYAIAWAIVSSHVPLYLQGLPLWGVRLSPYTSFRQEPHRYRYLAPSGIRAPRAVVEVSTSMATLLEEEDAEVIVPPLTRVRTRGLFSP